MSIIVVATEEKIRRGVFDTIASVIVIIIPIEIIIAYGPTNFDILFFLPIYRDIPPKPADNNIIAEIIATIR